MNSLTININLSLITEVTLTNEVLSVQLGDGRFISIPIAWYPRLHHATTDERNNFRLIGEGKGIHWEALDEDIGVEQIIAGIPSQESQKSLKRWLDNRQHPTNEIKLVP